MEKGKKIGIGIGTAFAIFIIIGIASSATTNESSKVGERSSANSISSTVTTTTDINNLDTTEIKTKPIQELLPTRDDIGTEWVITTATPFKNNATGFVDGLDQIFTLGSGYVSSELGVTIYKFDSSDNANKYYDNFVA